MANVLVTGAAGFLGWHMVRYLKSKNHWVRGVDKQDPPWVRSGADEFITYDLCDKHDIAELFNGIDWVFHFAANEGGIEFKASNKSKILVSNSQIDTNVLEAIVDKGIMHSVFASSLKASKITSIEEFKGAEEAYLSSKFFMERLCDMTRVERHITVKVARLENIYGPLCHLNSDREKNIAAICRKIITAKPGKPIELLGDGYDVRRYIYIDDAVDALYQYMKANCTGPVNIYGTEKVSIKEIVHKIQGITGKEYDVTYAGTFSSNACPNKDPLLDVERWTTWKSKCAFDESFKFTYDWIQANVTTE